MFVGRCRDDSTLARIGTSNIDRLARDLHAASRSFISRGTTVSPPGILPFLYLHRLHPDATKMNPSKSSQNQASLFEVYLRLRPPYTQQQQEGYGERYLTVEPPEKYGSDPTRILLQPPSESRKRAVEKFAFTKVFEEDAQQLDLFKGTRMDSLVKGVLCDGQDGMVATLGVTGSGKV